MSTTKKVIILGTGGNCIDIFEAINDINLYSQSKLFSFVGFIDDDKSLWGKDLYGYKVLGPIESAQEFKDCFFVNGIGNPLNFWEKNHIISKTDIPLEKFLTIIHPTAYVSKMAKIGKGTVILQNVTITSNVRIGNHVIILPNSVISHNDLIDNYTCIAGGVCLSGSVDVGKSCYLGTNSSIIGNIRIGEYCLLGMGSVLLTNMPYNSVFAGNPAKYLRCTC